MKNQKGITLVAMIITIIVMLILAGVSVRLAIGNNGVVKNSIKAADHTLRSEAKEYIMEAYGATIGKYEEFDQLNVAKLKEAKKYFESYMKNYGTAELFFVIDIRGTIGSADQINTLMFKGYKIICKLNGEEEESTYYLIDNQVYREDEPHSDPKGDWGHWSDLETVTIEAKYSYEETKELKVKDLENLKYDF